MATAEQKKAALLRLLDSGVAMVHLDARQPGVRVPPQHRDNGHLRLNLSYKYDGIQMLVDWYRIGATLSFGGEFYRCILPWEAVFGITAKDGEGQVWVEDMPQDVVEVLAEKKPRSAPHLKLVH